MMTGVISGSHTYQHVLGSLGFVLDVGARGPAAVQRHGGHESTDNWRTTPQGSRQPQAKKALWSSKPKADV